VIGLIIGVRRADGRIVPARDAAITVILVHGPRTRMATMLHTWWRFDVNSFRSCGRLRGRRRTVSRDAVLWDTSCHRRGARDAMRTLTRRWNVPGIRKGANVGWRERR
jgi:hypothetical protein